MSQDTVSNPGAVDGVPLYLRVAMSIRASVTRGEYPVGSLLPRFEALAERHGVGMNTIRKAIQILSSEGIVSAARGQGTRITSRGAASASHHIRTTISDPLTLSPEVAVTLLQTTEIATLPPELDEGYRHAARYLRVQKLHSYHGTPFAVFDICVDAQYADRFPPNALATTKVSYLLRQHADSAIETSREELTIAHSDTETAEVLHYPLAAPLARLRRWHLTGEERVLYACLALYRGDTFVWDVTRPWTGKGHLAGQIIPAIRKKTL